MERDPKEPAKPEEADDEKRAEQEEDAADDAEIERQIDETM